MYSDGYPDQIGGTGSKKFMTKQFKEILMNNRHLPMVQQENILRQHLYNWQGEHEQMDDILVIGIRLVK
jgi:serine phosphatase RsbU (regulator of sigma subunit)